MSGECNTNFGLTKADLEKAQRRVPIFSITGFPEGHKLALTNEQFLQVDGQGYIKASLLTAKQLREIDDNLDLDEVFEGFSRRTDNLVINYGNAERV